MNTNLTENDRKILKEEKRIGFVFLGIILSFGGLFNLFYFIIYNESYLLISLVDIGIILLAFFVLNSVNKNVNRDLKENTKEFYTRIVEKKLEEKSYEAGSGNLYIPILGDLFPKIWGQKMTETIKYFIVSNNHNYEVDKEFYNNISKGEEYKIYISKHSSTILSFHKLTNKLI